MDESWHTHVRNHELVQFVDSKWPPSVFIPSLQGGNP
jgi:hypothetical protein